MSEISFQGRMAPGEKKWFALTWNDELAGNPPAIPAATVQAAEWAVESGDVSILETRIDNYTTGVKVHAAGNIGENILTVEMTTDGGEVHVRRIKIDAEQH